MKLYKGELEEFMNHCPANMDLEKGLKFLERFAELKEEIRTLFLDMAIEGDKK